MKVTHKIITQLPLPRLFRENKTCIKPSTCKEKHKKICTLMPYTSVNFFPRVFRAVVYCSQLQRNYSSLTLQLPLKD